MTAKIVAENMELQFTKKMYTCTLCANPLLESNQNYRNITFRFRFHFDIHFYVYDINLSYKTCVHLQNT